MILELENLLVSTLLSEYEHDTVTVEAWPEDVSEYTFRGKGAAVLVRYSESEFTRPDGAEAVRQMMTPAFLVITVVRDLRTHSGAYAIMDRNRGAIVGLEYRNSLFYAVREGLMDRDENVWFYGQLFAVRQRVKQV